MEELAKNLIKIGKPFFLESTFSLKKKSATTFIIDGDNISYAIDKYRNDSRRVKVLKWFDEFWVYIQINIIPSQSSVRKSQFPNIFFSLSAFQGENDDEIKTQLFRAEWDNYEDLFDDHSQPHWHICPYSKYSKEFHKDFEEFIDLTATDDDFSVFAKSSVSNNIIDLTKFHFAMNGQWSENNSDIHRIKIDSELTNWFSGILNHIRKELLYTTEK